MEAQRATLTRGSNCGRQRWEYARREESFDNKRDKRDDNKTDEEDAGVFQKPTTIQGWIRNMKPVEYLVSLKSIEDCEQ